jgi:hypothetical protein
MHNKGNFYKGRGRWEGAKNLLLLLLSGILFEKLYLMVDSHSNYKGQDSLDSMFNLLGIFQLANIDQNAGIDIWNDKTDRVPLLQKALDFCFLT